MALFTNLNETQILDKAKSLEKEDGYEDWESKAAIKFKCENDGKKVIVVEYIQCEFNWRRAVDKDIIERYWLVINSEGICESMHMRYWAARRAIGLRNEYKAPAPRKANAEALEIYSRVRSNDLYGKDAGNCAPTAIAIASGIPYEVVRNKAMEFGYDPVKGGMRGYQIDRLMKALGIEFETCTNEVREIAKTTKSFEKKSIQGRYVMSIDGHALAAVNGTICDFTWNENRRIRVARRIISVNKV